MITDHRVRETLQITDRSYVVRSGKVLCHGSPAEVISHLTLANIISETASIWRKNSPALTICVPLAYMAHTQTRNTRDQGNC